MQVPLGGSSTSSLGYSTHLEGVLEELLAVGRARSRVAIILLPLGALQVWPELPELIPGGPGKPVLAAWTRCCPHLPPGVERGHASGRGSALAPKH